MVQRGPGARRSRSTSVRARPDLGGSPSFDDGIPRRGGRSRGLDRSGFLRPYQRHYIDIDDSGGTARDLSKYVFEVLGLGVTYEPELVTGVDDTGRRVVAGIQASSVFTIRGRFHPRATVGPDAVLSGAVGKVGTVAYGPVGNNTGSRKISGEFFCLSYEVSSLENGDVEFEARFQNDGSVTLGTW